MLKKIHNYLYMYFSVLKTSKFTLIGFVILFLFVAMLDMLSIALIGPYVMLISDMDKINNSFVFRLIASYYGDLPHSHLIIIFGIALVVLFVIKGFASYFSQKRIVEFSFNQQKSMIDRIVKKFQNVSYEYLLKSRSSDFINTVVNLTNMYTHQVLLASLRLVSESIIMIIILLLLLYVSYMALGILAIFISAVYFIYSSMIKGKMQKSGKQIIDSQDCLTKYVSLAFDGFKEFRVYSKESYIFDGITSASSDLSNANSMYRRLQIIPKLMLEVSLITFVVALGIFTIISGYKESQLLVILSVFGVAAVRIIPSFTQILSAINNLKFSKSILIELHEKLANMSAEKYADERDSDLKRDISGDINIHNLTFAYNSKNSIILQDVNITIPQNSMVGIIGSSGSGKTTFIDIIAGFLKNNNSIEVGGLYIDDCIKSWQEMVAYIPQNTFMSDGTIRQNIVLSNVNMNEETLFDAIQKSYLFEVIERLPDGIDTQVGEKGGFLSGGQRQRVAIARAFYFNKKYIIMDEITSELDNHSEEKITETLKLMKGTATFIIVAHRFSTLKSCDFILKVDNGKITKYKSTSFDVDKKLFV